MKYMLLIYSAESAWTPEEWKSCVETSAGICQELAANGKLDASSPLLPVETATTVRIRDGKSIVTTGPFAETTEQLGGFYLIDVADLNEAIAIAERLPPAGKGTVEIRPIFDLEGLPTSRLGESFAAREGRTEFMLLCYDDEQAWAAAGQDAHMAAMQEAIELTHKLDANNSYLSASPLHPSLTATCVRVRGGKRLITDGPFAETREVLGGYYLILAEDQSEAAHIAAQHSGARVGSVEVRQVFDIRTIVEQLEDA